MHRRVDKESIRIYQEAFKWYQQAAIGKRYVGAQNNPGLYVSKRCRTQSDYQEAS